MLEPYVLECFSLCTFRLALVGVGVGMGKGLYERSERQKWSSSHFPQRPTWLDEVADSEVQAGVAGSSFVSSFSSDCWSCGHTVAPGPLLDSLWWTHRSGRCIGAHFPQTSLELFFHRPGSVVECASLIAWVVTLNSQLPIPSWTSSCPALSLIV